MLNTVHVGVGIPKEVLEHLSEDWECHKEIEVFDTARCDIIYGASNREGNQYLGLPYLQYADRQNEAGRLVTRYSCWDCSLDRW